MAQLTWDAVQTLVRTNNWEISRKVADEERWEIKAKTNANTIITFERTVDSTPDSIFIKGPYISIVTAEPIEELQRLLNRSSELSFVYEYEKTPDSSFNQQLLSESESDRLATVRQSIGNVRVRFIITLRFSEATEGLVQEYVRVVESASRDLKQKV